MGISICIPTYNRLQDLKCLLDSIIDGFSDYPYEIIIADGGSTDGTVEYLKRLNNITLIEQKELTGAVKAFNACFKIAKYEYIYWPPDDFILVPEVLIKACQLMDKHDGLAIVCPKLMEPTIGNLPGIGTSTRFLLLGKTCIFRASVLKEIDYLDDNFRTYFVDGDSCLSVLNLGYSIIFTREVGVLHNRVQDDNWEFNRKTMIGRESEYYRNKWAALNSKIFQYVNSSPLKKYWSTLFVFICVQMLKPGFRRFLINRLHIVIAPLYDYLLERCIVFRAREYDYLKDFYLAQKLPAELISSRKGISVA